MRYVRALCHSFVGAVWCVSRSARCGLSSLVGRYPYLDLLASTIPSSAPSLMSYYDMDNKNSLKRVIKKNTQRRIECGAWSGQSVCEATVPSWRKNDIQCWHKGSIVTIYFVDMYIFIYIDYDPYPTSYIHTST